MHHGERDCVDHVSGIGSNDCRADYYVGAILNMNQDESSVGFFKNRSINSVKLLSGSVDI